MIDSDFSVGFKQGQAHGKQIMLEKIELIKADIQRYEADCLLLEDRPVCQKCNDTMFKSIYHIIDKHIEVEE